MKNQNNLALLRNYLAGNTGSAEYQYAVEELNRQLAKGELTRDDLLHDLGFATINGEDAGCDSCGLAEAAGRDFPTEAVRSATAETSYADVRENSPELFDFEADAEAIADGYVSAASALPPTMSPEEIRGLFEACDLNEKPIEWSKLNDRDDKVSWIQDHLCNTDVEPDHSPLYDAIIEEIEALPEAEQEAD